MALALTKSDIHRLAGNPIPEVRASLAAKIATEVSYDALTKREREIALDILQIMAQDTATLVREALAKNLVNAPSLPRDLALSIAHDIERVAVPMLEFSSVFTDSDLVDIVRTGSPAKQTAIANRRDLSTVVALSIIETTGEPVVATVVANEEAYLTNRCYNRALERFPGSKKIHRALAMRRTLPIEIAEKLAYLVSRELRAYLVEKHDLPPNIAQEIMVTSREGVTVKLMDPATPENDLEKFVRDLYGYGRLTPSLVVQALAIGDIRFAEFALARLAMIPSKPAQALTRDPGPLGLKAVCEKAGVDKRTFMFIRLGFDVFLEMKKKSPFLNQREFCRNYSKILQHHKDELDGWEYDTVMHTMEAA